MTTATATTAPPAGRRADVSGRWAIDADRSSLKISVKVGFVATVSGRFTDVAGVLEVGRDLSDSSISVEVATSSLTSGSSHWDSVLTNAGLIDADANPAIAFRSTALTATGKGWRLDGELVTARARQPISLDLECCNSDGGDRITFRATGSLLSRDAVRMLSQPGVERLVGKTMTVDLLVEAVRF